MREIEIKSSHSKQTKSQKNVNALDSTNDELLNDDILIESYSDFVKECVKKFWRRTKKVFSDFHVVKWSFWWAMATCGQFQVGKRWAY